MQSTVIEVTTGRKEAVVDLTSSCERWLAELQAVSRSPGGAEGHLPNGAEGLLHVWVPHATAGLAVIETGAGSDEDLLAALRELLPVEDRWRHRHGSRGHGRDHVLPGLVAPFLVVPVIEGRLALGTWQSLCLVDTNGDNPVRQVRLSFLPG